MEFQQYSDPPDYLVFLEILFATWKIYVDSVP